MAFLISDCSFSNFYEEAKYKWNERQEAYDNMYGINQPTGETRSLLEWINTKVAMLGSSILVSELSQNRPYQYRVILNYRSEVEECLIKLDNQHPCYGDDDKKVLKTRNYIVETLQATDMAIEALYHNEREDLEKAKDKVVAARAVYYR